MIAAEKAKVATRSRVSFIRRLPHYSPRLVFGLGVVQLVCGIALLFLSLVMFRLDREKTLSWSISLHFLEGVLSDLVRVTWLGGWVFLSGLITLLVSFRPYSNCQIYGLLLSSLLSLAITGVFAILISNHVIQHSVLVSMLSKDQSSSEALKQSAPPTEESLPRANPTLFMHVFMLSFCTVAFVISMVTFSIVSHHLCSCSGLSGKSCPDYHIYDTSTWSKKERIVQWVMQQSQLSDHSEAPRTELFLTDLHLNCAKLSGLHSSTTNSTKLSLNKS